MGNLLNKINKPNDIKKIPESQYKLLAAEIREFILDAVSKKGGHLAANLGTVELTMALHLFLDFPKDKLIWDVGHQSYTHKILTGRKEGFEHLRDFGGMSGFPKRHESDCDAFDTGHSSTSLSVANGMVCARELSGTDEKIVAVIGDGALSGGMAFEALNNIGKLKTNLIIILNDNKMSISENVGGMASYLGNLRTSVNYTGFKSGLENALNKIPVVGNKIVMRLKKSKDSLKALVIDGMLFEDMGITYIGPIDGHNIPQVLSALEGAAQMNKPVLIHAVTQKGKGYPFAEEHPEKFHGVAPFSLATGNSTGTGRGKTFTETFSETMVKLGAENKKIVGITAAMEDGTGLASFKKHYPDRFFDVGIAEEHAVTFAAGMAARGYHPVVAVYSTFLQRAYDQIMHDVSLPELPVTFAIDRAGIVGRDGETHQGIFDLSYLSGIPNLTVMAPASNKELEMMLKFAVDYPHPVAIRYPKYACDYEPETVSEIECGKADILTGEGDIVIFSVGTMIKEAFLLKERLEKEGISARVINARFAAPVDKNCVIYEASKARVVVTLEENSERGGFGERVASIMAKNVPGSKLCIGALESEFIPQGEVEELKNRYGLNMDKIYDKIKSLLSE